MAAQTVLVTKLTGQAWMRGSDGNLTVLREGMRIPADAEIVTASGSTVQLQADGQPPLMVGENQDVHLTADLIQPPTVEEAAVASPANAQIDQIIAAINAGQDPFDELDPTAATLSGGSEGGSGHDGGAESHAPSVPAFPTAGRGRPGCCPAARSGICLRGRVGRQTHGNLRSAGTGPPSHGRPA